MDVTLALEDFVQICKFLTKLTELLEFEILAHFRMSLMALFRGAVLNGADFFLVVFTKLAITNLKVSAERIHFTFFFLIFI